MSVGCCVVDVENEDVFCWLFVVESCGVVPTVSYGHTKCGHVVSVVTTGFVY